MPEKDRGTTPNTTKTPKAKARGLLPARDREKEMAMFKTPGKIPSHFRNDPFFKQFQSRFFKALSALPVAISEGIVHHQNEMTGKQKYDLAAVGEAFSSSIPLDFLSDTTSPQKAYQTCINSLDRLNQTLNASPRLVSLIGQSLQKSLDSFKTLLIEEIHALERSHFSNTVKNPLLRGLKGVERSVGHLETTIRHGLALAEPHKGLPTLSHLDHFKQSFQLGFFKGIMPVPYAIIQGLISLHDAMRSDQRDELATIGKSFVTTAFDLITARRTPEECFEAVANNFVRLGKFLSNAPELLMKGATLFLENSLPFGKFLSKFSSFISQSDLPDKPKTTMSKAVEHMSSVLKEFQGVVEKGQKASKPTPPTSHSSEK